MNWANAFELMCYLLTAVLLFALIKMRDSDGIFLFSAAAIVGYIMEMGAVAVTGIYKYSPEFWFSIGASPNQFPVFGGLMWGGLTVCAFYICRRVFGKSKLTAFASGFLIVTMDLFLDVCAIRLSGGFWVWEGREIANTLSMESFFGVIWVNFLGYIIETPTVAFITMRKPASCSLRGHFRWLGITVLGALLVTAAGSGAALGLDYLLGGKFSPVAFCFAWLAIFVCAVLRLKVSFVFDFMSVVVALFWTAMYVFCIAGLLYLRQVPVWLTVFAFACWGATVFLSFARGRDMVKSL